MKRRWRRGRAGNRGRFPSPLYVGPYDARKFVPVPLGNPEPIYLEPGELEVLRLIDFQGLSQSEAGEKMGTSRGTVWRLLQTAKKKVVRALVEGRQLIISS